MAKILRNILLTGALVGANLLTGCKTIEKKAEKPVEQPKKVVPVEPFGVVLDKHVDYTRNSARETQERADRYRENYTKVVNDYNQNTEKQSKQLQERMDNFLNPENNDKPTKE